MIQARALTPLHTAANDTRQKLEHPSVYAETTTQKKDTQGMLAETALAWRNNLPETWL